MHVTTLLKAKLHVISLQLMRMHTCYTGKDVPHLDMGKIMMKRIHIVGSTLRSRSDAFKARLIADFQVCSSASLIMLVSMHAC